MPVLRTAGLRAFAVALLATAIAVLASAGALAATTEVVKPSDVSTVPSEGQWLGSVSGTGSYKFVEGPAQPPAGNGSLQLDTPEGADKASVKTFAQNGKELAEVDALGYSTYRYSSSEASPAQVPSINMEVDPNGAAEGGYTTLVFEPVYNTVQDPIVEGAWQNWDAYNDGTAIWWSSRAIPGVCASGCFVTWDAIVAANPEATIISYGVNQGSGNSGLLGATDALEISVAGDLVRYDFEPFVAPPVTKDECKNGGWKTFDNPSFKNQGECVSFVASAGRAA